MNTDLLGDPLPEPLPTNARLNDEEELVGHEIRAVFRDTEGIWGHAGMVIVTATGCWLALDIEGYSIEDAYIQVRDGRWGKEAAVELVGYVPACQLRDANCISDVEYARFKALESEHEETERQRKANHLRQQLAELEGSPSRT